MFDQTVSFVLFYLPRASASTNKGLNVKSNNVPKYNDVLQE